MDGKIKAPPPAGRIWLVGLKILVIRATRPSRKSSAMAMKIAIDAISKRPSMACTMEKKPANSAAVVNRLGSR